jgi:hypothetical protein
MKLDDSERLKPKIAVWLLERRSEPRRCHQHLLPSLWLFSALEIEVLTDHY